MLARLRSRPSPCSHIPGTVEQARERTLPGEDSPQTRSRARLRRRGATVVESALVLSVFLMLLFGMFEYCRFLLVLHVTNNAARDGVRYATVQVNCQPGQVATTQAAILAYTTTKMSGLNSNLQGYQVAVYAVDQAGLDLTPSVVRPKTKSVASPAVYPDPFNSSDPNAVPWNSAPFPDRLAITIKGTYKPILPTFLFMPSSLPLSITAIMGGEG